MTRNRGINMQWGSVSIIELSLMKNAFSKDSLRHRSHALPRSLNLAKRLRYGALQFGCSFCCYKWASYGINFAAKRQEKSITRECLINILRYLARPSAASSTQLRQEERRDGNNKKFMPQAVQNFKYKHALADVKAVRGMLLINQRRRPVTAHQPNSKIN